MNSLTPTQQQVIAAFLMEAQKNDIKPGVDMPYMPEEKTTFQEAITYLKANGKILVQGGTVFHMENYGCYVSLTGSKALPVLPWSSIEDILAANYPGRPSTQIEVWEPVGEEELIHQPTIVYCVPMEGLGLFAPHVEYGVDIDLLLPEAWQVTKFTTRVADGAMYVCETDIDQQPHTVWFHCMLGVYIAQAIPLDLLSE